MPRVEAIHEPHIAHPGADRHPLTISEEVQAAQPPLGVPRVGGGGGKAERVGLDAISDHLRAVRGRQIHRPLRRGATGERCEIVRRQERLQASWRLHLGLDAHRDALAFFAGGQTQDLEITDDGELTAIARDALRLRGDAHLEGRITGADFERTGEDELTIAHFAAWGFP